MHTSGLAFCLGSASSFRTLLSRHGRFAAGSGSSSPGRDAMVGVVVGEGELRFLDSGSGTGDDVRGTVCDAGANPLTGLCVDCFRP